MPSPYRTTKKKSKAPNARRAKIAKPKRPKSPKAAPAPKVQRPKLGQKMKAKAIEFRRKGGQLLAYIWS